MSSTTTAFDSKLRELELEATPPIDQMDNHWSLLRDQLHPPLAPANKPFFKNPYLSWSTIAIVTTGLFFLFKSRPTNDIPSLKSITNDSASLPADQKVIDQDTLPVKKAEKNTTQKYPVKRVNATVIKKDTITKEIVPETSKKLPIKKIFGITTRSAPLNKKDTIRLEKVLSNDKNLQDTVYFTPIKNKSISSNVKVTPTAPSGVIHPSNKVAIAVNSKTNIAKAISVAEVSSAAKTEIMYSDYIIIEDTNRFQNLEQVLNEPYLKRKVVYIDLWGTRCAPCIEEFKHSQELKEKYRSKDLVFLYLKSPYSFDDSKEWNEMIYKHHLTGMNVSMSIGFYTDQFWNKYSRFYSEERLFGIPTYLIVNKKGEIVDYDAPRPSSGTVLFEKLDKELAN